jgi:hypothetical protein
MVTPGRPPARARLAVLPWFLGFTAAGVFTAWAGLSGLVPALREIASGAPDVSYRPRDMLVLPLALSCFALAVNTAIVAATLRPDGRPAPPTGRAGRWIVIMVGVALAGAALSFVASPLISAVLADALARRGYQRCPAPFALRNPPPPHWVLPAAGGRCSTPAP